MARILVLFGTTEGQTAKIAQALALAIRAEGIDVDVVDADTHSPAPEPYAGVVVAASVHAGRYQRSVRRWVRAHARALHNRETGFVSVCLGVLEHEPEADRELRAIQARFLSETGWQPAITKVVAGALPYTKYNWLKRAMMKRIVRKAGGDTDTSRDYEYTDWHEVRRFGTQFVHRVLATLQVQSALSCTLALAP